MAASSPSSVLSFSDILSSQLDDSLPYPALKTLLRSLANTHPAYPRRGHHPSGLDQCILSQTQANFRTPTQCPPQHNAIDELGLERFFSRQREHSIPFSLNDEDTPRIRFTPQPRRPFTPSPVPGGRTPRRFNLDGDTPGKQCIPFSSQIPPTPPFSQTQTPSPNQKVCSQSPPYISSPQRQQRISSILRQHLYRPRRRTTQHSSSRHAVPQNQPLTQPASQRMPLADISNADESTQNKAEGVAQFDIGQRPVQPVQSAQCVPVVAEQVFKLSQSPSRLRRPRRKSRRRVLPPQDAKSSTPSHTPDQDELPPNAQESPLICTPPSSLPCRNKRPRLRSQLIPSHRGVQINDCLYRLIRESSENRPITWRLLRSTLIDTSDEYLGFCSVMDSLFDLDDPLVAFSSDDGNEMCNSQSSNACVFYSNLFWESAWNDYCAEKNA